MIKKYIKEEDKSPTFEVIFIDEAQDLSPIQYKWHLLSYGIFKKHNNRLYRYY
jgi:superfamily I DNA/RNA helicase